MRMPPGSLIAVRYAGDRVWHERLLLWPVRSDKGHGAWLTEDGAGKLREEAVGLWVKTLDLKNGYPTDFRGETTQFEYMVEEPDLKRKVQAGRVDRGTHCSTK